MRKAKRPALFAALSALTFAALAVAGCSDSAQSTAVIPSATSGNAIGSPQNTPPSTGNGSSVLEIIEVPETSSPRDALNKSLGDITWTIAAQDEVAGGDSQENQNAAEKVFDTLIAQGSRLAAVNYVALAMEDYKEVTGQLTLTAADFEGSDVALEYIGRVNGLPQYLLFSYRGKDIPQRPDRPQVFRWIQPYALYDNFTQRVVKLVATIQGEVHE